MNLIEIICEALQMIAGILICLASLAMLVVMAIIKSNRRSW